ncbi:BQ2448_6543 [Microbotryum intermedium]|uniref:Translation initiation factor eIF2B subunit beta n=1 Tax=Microbotryum intermedium TaxID=269621 RepID=A0A238FPI1_9BASI|nr:BQ2448_6543 [Microbotryum intermedium]
MMTESVSRVNVLRRMDALALRLRRSSKSRLTLSLSDPRQLIGSRQVALEVVRLLREVVSGAKFSSFPQLVEHLNEIGHMLQDAGPKEAAQQERRTGLRYGHVESSQGDEIHNLTRDYHLRHMHSRSQLVITNMTRRIIMLISEEYATALSNVLADATTSSSPATSMSIPPTPALGPESNANISFFNERDLSGPSRSGRQGSMLGSMFDLLGHKPASPSTSAWGSAGLASPALATTSAFAASQPLSALSTPNSSRNASPTTSPSASIILQRPVLSLRAPSLATPPLPHVQIALEDDFSKKSFSLKPVFIEAIQELMDEVEFTYRSVGEQSIDHIHSGETILTLGHSQTVLSFLKAASRKRKFTVLVAETAPSYSGRQTALALSQYGIPTILIPDSNIFALLPRCSKVLLGPHLVLADGALLSIAGSLPLALAANRMRVPVVIVGGMFKFSPVYLGEADWGIRDLGSPQEVLEPSDAKKATPTSRVGGEDEGDETEVLNPYYDVVPAELVSLYITNLGGHPSSLLYRLLNETYAGATT